MVELILANEIPTEKLTSKIVNLPECKSFVSAKSIASRCTCPINLKGCDLPYGKQEIIHHIKY